MPRCFVCILKFQKDCIKLIGIKWNLHNQFEISSKVRDNVAVGDL